MAKYFIDTEFIEGFHKPLFGKRRHFIDLISIGIVCSDGREYYAISKDFNPKDASEWVKENVIAKLSTRKITFYDSPRMRSEALLWKSNEVIAEDIKNFFGYEPVWTDYGSDEFSKDSDIEIYAYYADYDWVVFCSLFGTMMDLPKGMPMYCQDLKQELDRRVRNAGCCIDMASLDHHLEKCKELPSYPKQENEHNALDDARWNKKLFDFVKTI